MSYAVKIEYHRKEGGHVVATVLESEAGNTSETSSVAGGGLKVPRRGRIKRLGGQLLSGSGATIDTRIGRTPGWAADSLDEVAGGFPTLPAASFARSEEIPYFAPDGLLFIRSGVDSGTDNVIAHEFEIIPELGGV